MTARKFIRGCIAIRLGLAAITVMSVPQPAAAILVLSPAGFADVMNAAQRREELKIVASDYVDQAPEFDVAARTRAHVLIERAARDAGAMTDQQYLLRLAEIAAQADNGHDSVSFSDSPLLPQLRLPLRMVWIGNRLFVARAAKNYAELAGGEVLNVGRWTPSQLFAHLRLYQGGKDEYRHWNLSWMIHNPAVLEALGATSSTASVPLRVRLHAGKAVVTTTVVPIGVDTMPEQPFPVGWWSRALSPDEVAKRWQAAGNVKAVPLYLQEPERYFRMADLTEIDALYVQFRSNFDIGEEKIAAFVASVEQRLATAPPRNLIVDLRFDTGGDNTQNRDLMRHIAEKVPGRIFVLTGPYTFSAGIASEAALIHDGGPKVTVLGEEPGDRDHWWSEHERVPLPYSKVWLDREVGHWDLVNGCTGQPHCFGDQFNVRIKTLAPAIRRKLTPAEWLEGKDPLLDEIGRILRPTKT